MHHHDDNETISIVTSTIIVVFSVSLDNGSGGHDDDDHLHCENDDGEIVLIDMNDHRPYPLSFFRSIDDEDHLHHHDDMVMLIWSSHERSSSSFLSSIWIEPTMNNRLHHHGDKGKTIDRCTAYRHPRFSPTVLVERRGRSSRPPRRR